MIHQPLGGAAGQATDIEIRANEILRIKQQMNEMMSRFTGRPIDQVTEDSDRDNYMTAREALDYGIIDRIMERNEN